MMVVVIPNIYIAARVHRHAGIGGVGPRTPQGDDRGVRVDRARCGTPRASNDFLKNVAV